MILHVHRNKFDYIYWLLLHPLSIPKQMLLPTPATMDPSPFNPASSLLEIPLNFLKHNIVSTKRRNIGKIVKMALVKMTWILSMCVRACELKRSQIITLNTKILRNSWIIFLRKVTRWNINYSKTRNIWVRFTNYVVLWINLYNNEYLQF